MLKSDDLETDSETEEGEIKEKHSSSSPEHALSQKRRLTEESLNQTHQQ